MGALTQIVGNEGELTRLFNFNTVAAMDFVVLGVVLFLLVPSQIDKPLIGLGGSQSNLSPPRIVFATGFNLIHDSGILAFRSINGTNYGTSIERPSPT